MNYYETLYIVHPALESGRLKDTITNVQNQIEKNEVNKLLCTEFWGKKRLSYPIEKQKYGTYVLVQYSGDGNQISAFNVEMEHNPNILAQITVKILEVEIREQVEDIETQILGKEKDSRPDDSSKEEEKVEDKKATTEEALSEVKEENEVDTEVEAKVEADSEELPPSELKIVETPEHVEEKESVDESEEETEETEETVETVEPVESEDTALKTEESEA